MRGAIQYRIALIQVVARSMALLDARHDTVMHRATRRAALTDVTRIYFFEVARAAFFLKY